MTAYFKQIFKIEIHMILKEIHIILHEIYYKYIYYMKYIQCKYVFYYKIYKYVVQI